MCVSWAARVSQVPFRNGFKKYSDLLILHSALTLLVIIITHHYLSCTEYNVNDPHDVIASVKIIAPA